MITAQAGRCPVCSQRAVLLLGPEGLQDDLSGPQARQGHVRQVRQVVFLGEGLTGLPPLPQEPALREEHDPLPVPAVVEPVQVGLQVDQLLVSMSLALGEPNRRDSYRIITQGVGTYLICKFSDFKDL